MVLHHMAYLSSQDDRSTGVEIQVVLHPELLDEDNEEGSTGVEIQVVLHHKSKKLANKR